MTATLALARVVADAVLYEGYLLYPYRASSAKNQVRWQFGVLGPPGAAEAGLGEESGMFADCLLDTQQGARVEVRLRFLQVQARLVEQLGESGYEAVEELVTRSDRWISWEEATEHEVELGEWGIEDLVRGQAVPVDVPGGEEHEEIYDDERLVGRLVRRREPLRATVQLSAAPVDGYTRLRARVDNSARGAAESKDDAIARSFIGAHLLLVADGCDFVSLLEPPKAAQAAVAACEQDRCWPVLAGPEGQTDVLLMSPIILYDHPSVAPESAGALFDSTEIDEILTLRVMTMTDQEKSEARATDPRAAEIIDRCDAMTSEELQRLHGALRSPHALADGGADGIAVPELRTPDVDLPPTDPDVPWWDPEADASVSPATDTVLIGGVAIAKGSLVTIRPTRRADAQDLFFTGRTGRVTGVHFDVDGSTHVAVVLLDDPAADLHDWYGRYLYFAPDELEPLASVRSDDRKERQS